MRVSKGTKFNDFEYPIKIDELDKDSGKKFVLFEQTSDEMDEFDGHDTDAFLLNKDEIVQFIEILMAVYNKM